MIKKLVKISLLALLVTASIFVWQRASNTLRSKRANLILISVDALRPDYMGIYGYGENTTPNIDAWSKDAFVFDKAYTVIPITHPSFSALFTGIHPARSGIVGNSINQPIKSKTLVSVLKENGFATAAFLTSDLFNKEINSGVANLAKDFDVYETYPYKNYQTNDHEAYEKFIDKAVSWSTENKDKRQFLWLHLMNTHPPYYPPSQYRCAFNGAFCEEIESVPEKVLASKQMEIDGCQKKNTNKSDVGLYRTLYEGEVAYMDNLFGRLLKSLMDNGLGKNTIVVFLSDHGEGFDHNYNFFHGGVLYQSSLRIPLIVRVPWLKPDSSKTKGLIDNTDIAPTLADLLELSIEDFSADGVSFASAFDGSPSNKSAKNNKDFIYFLSEEMDKYAVYDGRYKYIYSLPDSCLPDAAINEELYDLESDPGEEKNQFMENRTRAQYLKTSLVDFLSKNNLSLPKTPSTIKKDGETPEKWKSIGY